MNALGSEAAPEQLHIILTIIRERRKKTLGLQRHAEKIAGQNNRRGLVGFLVKDSDPYVHRQTESSSESESLAPYCSCLVASLPGASGLIIIQ